MLLHGVSIESRMDWIYAKLPTVHCMQKVVRFMVYSLFCHLFGYKNINTNTVSVAHTHKQTNKPKTLTFLTYAFFYAEIRTC